MKESGKGDYWDPENRREQGWAKKLHGDEDLFDKLETLEGGKARTQAPQTYNAGQLSGSLAHQTCLTAGDDIAWL